MIVIRSRSLSLLAAFGVLLCALGAWLPSIASANGGAFSITSDRAQYAVGDVAEVCGRAPVPMAVTITYVVPGQPDQVVASGGDIGSCFNVTIVAPPSMQCFKIAPADAQQPTIQPASVCFTVVAKTPPPIIQHCGLVSALGGHVTSSGAQQVEDCFYQAYQQCSAATMLFTDAQVDAGTKYSFDVKSNGGACTIAESAQTYTLPLPSGPTKQGTCAGLTETQSGLLFISCQGGGNVVVPNS